MFGARIPREPHSPYSFHADSHKRPSTKGPIRRTYREECYISLEGIPGAVDFAKSGVCTGDLRRLPANRSGRDVVVAI